MDSKYNAISHQQPNNPFNFKRKLTNGHLNSNNDQFKRFKSNNGNNSIDFPKTNAGQNGNGKGLSIEEQRHQLPVYKVQKQ